MLILPADILYQCVSATYIFTEESYCVDSTKAVYFGLCRQETRRIMKEVREGRDSLTDLLALAFFSAVKNVIFDLYLVYMDHNISLLQ